MFRLLRHEIEQTREGDSVVITLTFHVEGPPGDRPFSLAITWPSGNTATLDSGGHLLPIEETGSTRLSVPMRLDNVPPNSACSVGLHIGGTPVGDVAFVID